MRNALLAAGIAASAIATGQTHGGEDPAPVAVHAWVRPTDGTPAALQHIGDITFVLGGNTITATFTFAPAYRYLDKWYDFRWINVIVNEQLPAGFNIDTDGDGCCDFLQGAAGKFDSDGDGVTETWLPFAYVDCPPAGAANDCASGTAIAHETPAIDPQPGQSGFGDGQPYYWNTLAPGAWPAAHTECLNSIFQDGRAGPVGNSIHFNTFLVIDAKTPPNPPANTFWVLEGFDWTFTSPAAGAPTATLNGPLAPNPALINNALNNVQAGANPPAAAFGAWTAAPRVDCPLQICPVQLSVTCTSFGVDPDEPNCCLFNWEVTNNGTEPVSQFYLDLEAGDGAQRCRIIHLDPWNVVQCYGWDNAFPSNWGVFCFMAPIPEEALQPGQTKRGMLEIDTNSAGVNVNIPGWHPFNVLMDAIHCHVTDYSPMCLGVMCPNGEFGPHIANDIHGRDQAKFWSPGGDWVCIGGTACPWDCGGTGDGNVNVTDLLALLAQWGGPGSCDFNKNGAVDVTDLLKLLAHYSIDPTGQGCPQ